MVKVKSKKGMSKGKKGKRTVKKTVKRPASRRYSPVYTEMLAAGNVQLNTGGTFVCRFADIPQAAQYSNLYKQFCIKKLQVMLLPRLNSYDANTTASIATSYWLPRIVYSVDDTPGLQAPVNEISVLTDNGAKVLTMAQKTTLTCWPKPAIGSQDLFTGTYVATRQRQQVWLNTESGDVSNPGVNVQHNGIRYWISGNPLYNEFAFDVYYRITFQLRDPA